MKNFFTLLFVFVIGSAHAATYYFSSVSGDDSRTSTQARNASTPWKSLSKLNTFFTEGIIIAFIDTVANSYPV